MKYSFNSLILTKKDIFLLLLWVGIGALLRFYNLTLKSVWGDEWATLVFSLGHGFREIPLDQLIDIKTLIAPLHYDANVPIAAVTEKLFSESNHPPLYYWLTHFWLGLWSQNGEFISIGIGRSPAAFFGVLLIPITFAVSWWNVRHKLTAHLGAIAMTISPYAIYLSQEARHYTLAMIWMMLSYGCLVAMIRQQQQRKSPSFVLLLSWIIVNSFGIASHYFMLLCFFAEGLVLFYFYGEEITNSWQEIPQFNTLFPPYWRRIIGGAIASGVCIFLLMSQWQSDNNGELTSWLNQDYGLSFEALSPPLRALGWLLGMVFMLPVEVTQTWLVVLSAIALLIILIWFIPKIFTALKNMGGDLNTKIFGGIILANLCTLLGITYVLKLDLTLAPRYSFIYFPSLIILLGIVLNYFWEQVKTSQNFWRQTNKNTVLIILGLMLISAISVNFDLAYRKPEDGKAIAKVILENSNINQTLIATHYWEVARTREQIGIAWALNSIESNFRPQFLIQDHFFEYEIGEAIINQAVATLPKPLDVWMINTHFRPSDVACNEILNSTKSGIKVTGYIYQKYICQP